MKKMKLNEAEMASIYGGHDEKTCFFQVDDVCAKDACTCYPGQDEAKEALRSNMYKWDSQFE